VTDEPIKEIEILYDGVVRGHEPQGAESARACRPEGHQPDVNMVSAPIIARNAASSSPPRQGQDRRLDGYIKLTVTTERQTRSVAGTVFSDGKPRFIQIKGINIDAESAST
jgi:D-3-phosphoglycerate dehydrogenase